MKFIKVLFLYPILMQKDLERHSFYFMFWGNQRWQLLNCLKNARKIFTELGCLPHIHCPEKLCTAFCIGSKTDDLIAKHSPGNRTETLEFKIRSLSIKLSALITR